MLKKPKRLRKLSKNIFKISNLRKIKVNNKI